MAAPNDGVWGDLTAYSADETAAWLLGRQGVCAWSPCPDGCTEMFATEALEGNEGR